MALTFTVGSLALIGNYNPAPVAGVNPASLQAGLYKIAAVQGANVVLQDLGSGQVAAPVTVPQSAVLFTYASG